MARAATAASTMDPLAELRRLRDADAALDQALGSLRDAQERASRAAAMLDQAILAARAEISAATDFLNTRRGAVGARARTLLAEAQRHLAQAEALAARTTRSPPSPRRSEPTRSPSRLAGQLSPMWTAGADTGSRAGSPAAAPPAWTAWPVRFLAASSSAGGARWLGGGYGGGFGGGRRGGGGGFGGRSPGGFGGSSRRGGGGRF